MSCPCCETQLPCTTVSKAHLEVQRYPPCCAAAWVLSLQIIVKLSQLLSLAVCQIASCIWQQLHCPPEPMMVLVIVWVELQHMPACKCTLDTHAMIVEHRVMRVTRFGGLAFCVSSPWSGLYGQRLTLKCQHALDGPVKKAACTCVRPFTRSRRTHPLEIDRYNPW